MRHQRDSTVYTCCQCLRRYTDAKAIEQHFQEGHVEFRCGTCVFKTGRKFMLTRHLKSHQANGANGVIRLCAHCTKPYKNVLGLAKHIKGAHSTTVNAEHGESVEEEKFICCRCLRPTVSRRGLITHLTWHNRKLAEIPTEGEGMNGGRISVVSASHSGTKSPADQFLAYLIDD